MIPRFIGLAGNRQLLLPKIKVLVLKNVKPNNVHYIPPTQYDKPLGAKMNPFWVSVNNWETAPLFASFYFAIGLSVCIVFWDCFHKVDVVFTTHSRKNISRTMNLRTPHVHKLMTVEQEYHPWPEMQNILDMMAEFEHREASKHLYCIELN